MSQILSGRINLSKIPQDLIKYNNAGEAIVWVDVAERREPSQYGDTHNVSIYDSANRQKIYIGELRPKDIGQAGDNAAPARPSAFPPQRPAAPAASAPAPGYAPQAPQYQAAAPAPAPAAPAASAPASAAAPVQQHYPRYQAPNPRTYPQPQPQAPVSGPNSLEPQPDDLPF